MALKQTNLFTYLFLLKKHKQCVNGVHIDFKEYFTILLCHPLNSVLKWVHAPTAPASMPLLKQCRSLTKCLNKVRSLSNEIPIICSFQGLLPDPISVGIGGTEVCALINDRILDTSPSTAYRVIIFASVRRNPLKACTPICIILCILLADAKNGHRMKTF